MAKIKLGSVDIQQLLNTYEANLRQVMFQAEHIKQTIRNLKAALPAIQQAELNEISMLTEVENMLDVSEPAVSSKTSKRRGRPPGVKVKKKAKKADSKAAAPETDPTAKKAKAKKKESGRSGGYKLSEYDLLVFQALEENGRAMITADLQKAIEDIKAAKGENVDPEEVTTMIIRSLQKLANRRDDIRKVAFEGRGRAYALPSWVNNQGVIKPAHKRKESKS
jgi:hypothetical protein